MGLYVNILVDYNRRSGELLGGDTCEDRRVNPEIPTLALKDRSLRWKNVSV